MAKNVGSADKVVRIVVGLALLGWAVVGSGNARWWGLVGIVPLATALLGICPLYSLLGVSTGPAEPKS